jgi:hypothetical protein
VRSVLGQLFSAATAALEDGDADTARSAVTSARTVATNKLPPGSLRARLRHGCRRAVAAIDGDAPPAVAAEYCRAMARAVDAAR